MLSQAKTYFQLQELQIRPCEEEENVALISTPTLDEMTDEDLREVFLQFEAHVQRCFLLQRQMLQEIQAIQARYALLENVDHALMLYDGQGKPDFNVTYAVGSNCPITRS